MEYFTSVLPSVNSQNGSSTSNTANPFSNFTFVHPSFFPQQTKNTRPRSRRSSSRVQRRQRPSHISTCISSSPVAYDLARRSSSPTLGKRLRQSRVLTSFPRISDNTPPASPKTSRYTKTPAEQKLSNLLKRSASSPSLSHQPESCKQAMPSQPSSPTHTRQSSKPPRPSNSKERIEVEVEVVDLQPDVLPYSPTRYVYDAMETPPLSPASTSSTEDTYGLFFGVVAGGSRTVSGSATATSSTIACGSTSGRQRKEQIAREERIALRSTMRQGAENPGKSASPQQSTTSLSWRSSARAPSSTTSKLRAGNAAQLLVKVASGSRVSDAEESALRLRRPDDYKTCMKAIADLAFQAQTAALTAEQSTRAADGQLSYYELYENAEMLLRQRGYLFNPAFAEAAGFQKPVEIRHGQATRKSSRRSAGKSLKQSLAMSAERRARRGMLGGEKSGAGNKAFLEPGASWADDL